MRELKCNEINIIVGGSFSDRIEAYYGTITQSEKTFAVSGCSLGFAMGSGLLGASFWGPVASLTLGAAYLAYSYIPKDSFQRAEEFLFS